MTIKQNLQIVRAVLLSGLLGSNLASLLLLNKPRKALSYIQYSLFGWRMVKGEGLAIQQFHEQFDTPSHVPIFMLPKNSLFTNWDANYSKDAVYLALLSVILKPETIFEIGTYQGESAAIFALNSSLEAKIYTLDLPPGGNVTSTLPTTKIDDFEIKGAAKSNYFYQSIPGKEKVLQLYGDSAVFNFEPFYKKVDLFFIDGAHSYEYVRSDTENAMLCVRRGGVIVWHDYGRWGVNGVTRWLNELNKSKKDIFRFPGSSLAFTKINE
jgi:Methyltransferase domain